MEELIRTPFVREVTAVCVDPSPTRPPLPSWLKSVPALVIIGESSPRIGPGPVNNWLFERRMGGAAPGPSAGPSMPPRNTVVEDRRIPAPSYKLEAVSRPEVTGRVAPPMRSDVSVSNNGRLPSAISATTEGDKSAAPPVLAGSETDSKVNPYYNLEMSDKKWSEIYSYLASRPADSADKTFELLTELAGGAASGGGGGGGGGGATARVSEKESALLREFEAYAASRDRDVKGPVTRR
jgi:hypothetical protein